VSGFKKRAKKVKILVMDVDGVLTDAGMYYGEDGEEFKKFNTKDGMGISLIHSAGIKTAIITKEKTKIVERRAKKLNITEVHQGVDDKLLVLNNILSRRKLSLDQACYIGDDINDYKVLREVGLAVVVNDAHERVKKVAHYVTARKGGEGAVREVCDLILEVHQINKEG